MRNLIIGMLLTVAVAACGGGGNQPTATGAGGPSSSTVGAATVNGSGATFPKAFYEEAIVAFKGKVPAVTVNYAGGGSGKGRQELQDQVVDFAGSDGIVKDEDKGRYKGGELLYIPTVAAPITVAYHLPGTTGLKLSPDTLAGIFQRRINRWDDAAIAADNSGLSLPPTAIVVSRRADGSGTTENFTKFLKAASPQWTLGAGATVEWPADTQAGNGNTGVAQIVKDTPGAIGYVDLSDARATGLATALIRNKAGRFVEPTLEAASAALAGVTIKDDLTYDPLNADGDAAYPITAPTWILVYRRQPDAAKATALRAFLEFVLTDGQAMAADLDFARLPEPLRAKGLDQLRRIEATG